MDWKQSLIGVQLYYNRTRCTSIFKQTSPLILIGFMFFRSLFQDHLMVSLDFYCQLFIQFLNSSVSQGKEFLI